MCTARQNGTPRPTERKPPNLPLSRALQSGGREFRVGGSWPHSGYGAVRTPDPGSHSNPCPCALILYLAGAYFPLFNRFVLSSYCVPSPALGTELHQPQCRESRHEVNMKERNWVGEGRGHGVTASVWAVGPGEAASRKMMRSSSNVSSHPPRKQVPHQGTPHSYVVTWPFPWKGQTPTWPPGRGTDSPASQQKRRSLF